MTKLLIPAAGLSTRYGLERPKFLLQHPVGVSMLTYGLKDVKKLGVTRVVVITLAEFFHDIDENRLAKEVSDFTGVDAEVFLLPNRTQSMVETLLKYIEANPDWDDFFMVKDSDNYISVFESISQNANFIAYANLNDFPFVTPGNKSFIDYDENHIVVNIAEKRVISNLINVGLIGFSSVTEFLYGMKKISKLSDIFLSDVIRVLIDDGAGFQAVKVSEYEDWGVLEDWLKYARKFLTFFVDLDGTLCRNEHPLSRNGGWSNFEIILENAELLLKGNSDASWQIIFTTSRSEAYRTQITNALTDAGFKDFQLIMGLYHSKRIIINDYSKSNPYPSSVALNLERNSRSLGGILESFWADK